MTDTKKYDVALYGETLEGYPFAAIGKSDPATGVLIKDLPPMKITGGVAIIPPSCNGRIEL